MDTRKPPFDPLYEFIMDNIEQWQVHRLIIYIFFIRESTTPDVHAADRSSYSGSLLFRALAAKPEFVTIGYDCKKAGSDIFVSVQVHISNYMPYIHLKERYFANP